MSRSSTSSVRRVLRHLRQARAEVALAEGRQRVHVGDDQPRLRERPHEVLALRQVDGRLAADRRVDLCQRAWSAPGRTGRPACTSRRRTRRDRRPLPLPARSPDRPDAPPGSRAGAAASRRRAGSSHPRPPERPSGTVREPRLAQRRRERLEPREPTPCGRRPRTRWRRREAPGAATRPTRSMPEPTQTS